MIAAHLSDQSQWSQAPVLDSIVGGLDELRFRGYRLLPSARILLRDGRPVCIGSRAFDILHVLVKARGCIVCKREIVKSVWPTTIVEESNLRFQVAQLRKALGDDQDLIKTIPGRGYLFALEADAAIATRDVREIEFVEVDTEAGAGPSSLLRLAGESDAPTLMSGGRVCAEARILLQQFLSSMGVQGSAVVLLVRLEE
jgi:DNA-binding winged helix-turn-helix (wHTH) protein